MSKPSTHCCECHGPFGEHIVAIRWPGSKREYCPPCWERVGQFRAVEELPKMRVIGAESEAAV